MISTDLLFLSSSRQGATGSGKTLLLSHLFVPLVQVWVVQTRETNWFCSVDAAGLSISAEHSSPFCPSSPHPLADLDQLGRGTEDRAEASVTTF